MPAGAIIGAAAPVIGSLFNIGRGRRQYRRNIQSMNHAHSLNKQMFDYQNAYNTPTEQMKRLKQAGLNPALMYGQGNTGNASGYPQVSPPENPVDNADATGIVNGLAQGATMALQKQQQSNLEAQEKETKSRTVLNAIEAAVKGGTQEEAKGLVRYQLENLKSDNKNKLQSLKNLQITEKSLNKDLTRKQIEIEDARILKAMNKLDLNHMQKQGISRLDPTIVKIAWRIANGVDDIFKNMLIDFISGTGINKSFRD